MAPGILRTAFLGRPTGTAQPAMAGGTGGIDAAVLEQLARGRSRIADGSLIGLSALAAPALAVSLMRALEIGWMPVMGLHIALAATIIATTLLRRRIPYGWRAGIVILTVAAIAGGGTITFGLFGGGLGYLAAAVLAVLFVDLRAGWALAGAAAVAIVVRFVLLDQGILPLGVDASAYGVSFAAWLNAALAQLLFFAAVGVPVGVFQRQLVRMAGHLAQERSRLRDVIESAPDGIMLLDERGRIVQANRRLAAIFGHDQAALPGQSARSLVTDLDLVPVDAVDAPVPREGLGIRRDGTSLPVAVSVGALESPGRAARVAIVRDLTEEKALQEQLLQVRKLEAVGRLTGGIAHDFNNLLSVVIGNLDLLAEGAHAGTPEREMIEQAQKAAVLGGELTKSLLAFARRQTLHPRVVMARDVVAAVLPILEHGVGKGVAIRLEAIGAPRPCRIDPVPLQLAMMNLVLNARDAMPRGGEVLIRIGGGAADAAHVPVAVSDTGTGMAPEVLARAAEPFFTTKGIGQGSGLGLSMIEGFIRQSGGDVRIESAAGRGTTVTLLLPAADAAPAAADSPSAAAGQVS